jgi:Zn-dependent protease with chaperone function
MLESKWRWALTSVVFLVVLGYFITTVMLPWAGRELAFIVPSKVNETISSGGMRLLDQKWFEPSELSDDKKNEIRESFTDLINTLPNSEFNYKLYFRNIGEANAFSLPAGEIILTDELVRLAENPEQITAILLHEIGHVHHRHVMQQVIRSSLISVAISMATSDLSALEDLVVVLPVFVLKSGYSQADEIEADAYMFEHMVRLQMNPIHFANVIQIITQDKSNIDGTTLKYFASHPETSKRIENAIRKSNEFLGDGDVF